MIHSSAARSALAARFKIPRFSPRTRRLRTLGAAGFAGCSVALLASELPAPALSAAGLPAPRFAANTLVGGLVAVPVRFDDAGSAAFLRPGDHVDVYAARDLGGAPASVPDELVPARRDEPRQGDQAATDVSVVAVPARSGAAADTGFPGGNAPRSPSGVDGLVLLAVDNATASRLAEAAASGRLSFALRSPSAERSG
jgi:pilus assembly protein CpaB